MNFPKPGSSRFLNDIPLLSEALGTIFQWHFPQLCPRIRALESGKLIPGHNLRHPIISLAKQAPSVFKRNYGWYFFGTSVRPQICLDLVPCTRTEVASKWRFHKQTKDSEKGTNFLKLTNVERWGRHLQSSQSMCGTRRVTVLADFAAKFDIFF